VNCLLDTCAFLWLALEPECLSAKAVKTINKADLRFLSSASIWEIVIKNASGKLPLPVNPREWIPSRMDFFQLAMLPMDQEVLFLSGELPMIHRDPFDRLIAADSIQRSLPVITSDLPFEALGATRIW
jgi:PIN domain nuclease of toxin-antitoxin system